MTREINDIVVVESIAALNAYRDYHKEHPTLIDEEQEAANELWSKFWDMACESVKDVHDTNIPSIFIACKDTHLYYDNIVAALCALGYMEDDDE